MIKKNENNNNNENNENNNFKINSKLINNKIYLKLKDDSFNPKLIKFLNTKERIFGRK